MSVPCGASNPPGVEVAIVYGGVRRATVYTLDEHACVGPQMLKEKIAAMIPVYIFADEAVVGYDI